MPTTEAIAAAPTCPTP